MTETKTFSYEMQILEQHLDSYGHVNNATYLTLYEQARWDLITSHGLSHERILKEKKGPVILEVKVRYKRELKNREKIVIKTQTKNVKDRFITISQWMEKADGEVASEAEFLVGIFDMEKRKLLRADDEWLRAIGVQVD